MNKDLTYKLCQIENCIGIQKDSVFQSCRDFEYMLGMVNGMIFVHSVMIDEAPRYVNIKRNRKKKVKIRHKSIQTRKVIL